MKLSDICVATALSINGFLITLWLVTIAGGETTSFPWIPVIFTVLFLIAINAEEWHKKRAKENRNNKEQAESFVDQIQQHINRITRERDEAVQANHSLQFHLNFMDKQNTNLMKRLIERDKHDCRPMVVTVPPADIGELRRAFESEEWRPHPGHIQECKPPRAEGAKKLVILESPYAGDIYKNIAYAKRCVRDCLDRGESPIVSHLLFTQPGILRDEFPEERKLGIEAGHAWYRIAEGCVVYIDHGISPGMITGTEVADSHGLDIEYRNLPEVS